MKRHYSKPTSQVDSLRPNRFCDPDEYYDASARDNPPEGYDPTRRQFGTPVNPSTGITWKSVMERDEW